MRVSVYVPENADKTQKQEFLFQINMLDEKNGRTELDKTQKRGQMSARFHFDYAKRFLGHYKHELAKSRPGSKEFREFGELVRVFEHRYTEAQMRLEREHEQARRIRAAA